MSDAAFYPSPKGNNERDLASSSSAATVPAPTETPAGSSSGSFSPTQAPTTTLAPSPSGSGSGSFSTTTPSPPSSSSSGSGSGQFPTPAPWSPPSSGSGSGWGSASGLMDGSAGGIVTAGLSVDLLLLIIAIFVVKCFRYSKNGNSCGCFSMWTDLISGNRLHWKSNLYFIINMVFIMITIPCIFHLGACFASAPACTWAIISPSPNPVFNQLAKQGDLVSVLTAAMSLLFVEMIASFFISVLSLRWFTESLLNPYEAKYPTHMSTQLIPKEDMVHEWNCIAGVRIVIFIFAVFILTVGTFTRVIVDSWLLSYWGLGNKSGVVFDSFSQPELTIVVLWNTFHYISFLVLCCKKTWTEHHLMHSDYAGFICPSCESLGGRVTSQCPTCNGTGLIYEQQNSHFAGSEA